MHKQGEVDNYQIDRPFSNFLKAMGVTDRGADTTLVREFAVIGEPGTGKSTGFKYVADQHGYKFVRVVCSRDMTVQDLLLDKTIKDGNIIDVESQFLKAVPEKAIILVDEFMVTPADVMAVLNSLLDFEKSITLPNGKKYDRHPENIIVFASNGEGHAGVKRQHGGFLDRLPVFYMDYSEKEVEVLKSKFGGTVEDATIMRLVKFAEMMRNARRNKGGINSVCSTRGLETILTIHANGAPIESAILYALKPKPEEVKVVNEFCKLAMGAEIVKNGETGNDEVSLMNTVKAENKRLKDALKKKDDLLQKAIADIDKYINNKP